MQQYLYRVGIRLAALALALCLVARADNRKEEPDGNKR